MDVSDYKEILEEARKEAFIYQDVEDGGTCNFDTPYVKNVDEDKLRKAAEDIVGIQVSDGYGIADGGLMILGLTKGQGNRRTKMAEAVKEVFEKHGLDAQVFYSVD